MNIDILQSPANSIAKVELAPGETLISEAGAMIAMSGDMSVKTNTYSRGGNKILKGIKRMFSGENFFMNQFQASQNGGDVFLGSSMMGDMLTRKIDGELIVQGGSFVACSNTIDVDTSWQGFKSFFSGESMFWVKLKGEGDVIVNSFGAIYDIDVEDTYIVDTGHIVAFEETLEFKVRKAGQGWFSAILGGEGLVCEFKGQGKVYCQTHNLPNFGHALAPNLKG
ncbi:MAG: TIGR00266 family protein [Planctomycetota bacterium]|nr:MAG: TIGR00266 family protein [Planctomycetota bacterium]